MREGLEALIDGTSDLCVGRAPLEGTGESGELPIRRPDLVVTDLRHDGHGNRGRIQAIKRRFSDVPLLVLETSGSLWNSEEILAMGANAFLGEPGNAGKLLQAIRGLLRGTAGRA